MITQHAKGTPRKSKDQRETERVDALWSQVRDSTLHDWARRSALLYLLRSARAHHEVLIAAKGFRGEPWFNHRSKSGSCVGDFSAWVDKIAAARAVDLGWTLEKWVWVWATVTLYSTPSVPTIPQAAWLTAAWGDISLLPSSVQRFCSTPLQTSPVPVTKWERGVSNHLPWVAVRSQRFPGMILVPQRDDPTKMGWAVFQNRWTGWGSCLPPGTLPPSREPTEPWVRLELSGGGLLVLEAVSLDGPNAPTTEAQPLKIPPLKIPPLKIPPLKIPPLKTPTPLR